MSALLTVDDALERILATVNKLPETQRIPLDTALGRVLAADIFSSIDVPGADNSAMDGYALRAADVSALSGRLHVTQRIPAGTFGGHVAAGTAARIFTGAPLPPGADAVVMQEHCVEEEGFIHVSGVVSTGENVRPRGQDIALSAKVLSAGRRLRPQDMGLLASVGCADVEVYRPLKVAILSTGDELVEPGQSLQGDWQVYNSNRYTLIGLLTGLGVNVVDMGIVADDPAETANVLQSAARESDCVISSGGVSVGEEDHVKTQVQRLGALDLWRLAIKPGKPLAFGTVGSTPFIGLPGNPTSVFVTFCLVARPYLLKRQGVSETEPVRLWAQAAFDISAGARQEYLRVDLQSDDGKILAQRFQNQSSGVLSSVSHSNALAVIPPLVTIATGDRVEVLLLDSFY